MRFELFCGGELYVSFHHIMMVTTHNTAPAQASVLWLNFGSGQIVRAEVLGDAASVVKRRLRRAIEESNERSRRQLEALERLANAMPKREPWQEGDDE